MSREESCLRFTPSAAEGLPDVTEVAVFPDRLEVVSGGRLVVVRFADIAEWPKSPRGWWWFRRRIGWRPRWLPVADRDWFHPPGRKFFSFYTEPRFVVFMPADDTAEYSQTCFRLIQNVLLEGGYTTFDLG